MYQFTINQVVYEHKDNITLLDFIRDHLHLTGTKNGCNEGVCGTCSVLVDGNVRKSCIVRLKSVHNTCITTIEGISKQEKEVFVRAFSEAGAVQCGFCTPGFVIRALSIYIQNPHPTREEVTKAIRGHICRCTGYVKIVDGILLAFDYLNLLTYRSEYRSIDSNSSIILNDTPQCILKTKCDKALHLSSNHDLSSIDNTKDVLQNSNDGLGVNLSRIDARSKILGTGIYVDDINIPDVVYASAIRSDHPRARILGIDITQAEQHEDFIRILTSKDVPGDNKIGHLEHISDWDVLIPIGEITRYVGDALAIVVSKTKTSLHEIKERIKVDYEILTPLTTIQQAIEPGAAQIHKTGNILSTESIKCGSIEEAIENSAYIVTERYTTPINEHAFLEPECAIAVPQDKDGLLMYSGGQSIYDEQREIARMLGIPRENIQVKGQLIGGAFGGKEDMSVQHHAALVAWILKRPTKVLFTREESLLVHPKRHPMEIEITTGCDTNGRLTGIKATIYSDTGAYASLGGPVLQRACTHIAGPYRYQAVDIHGKAVYTNNPPAGAFRGFGVCQAAFASESNLNLLAEKVGISPLELRIRNAIRPGDSLANGQQATINTALVQALEAVRPTYENAMQLGKAVGISSFHKNSGLGVGVSDTGRCLLSIEDRKIHIRTSAACLGQGVGTVLIQIVCETLRIPSFYVEFESPDTSRTPDAGTTTASRQSLFTGEATRIAAHELHEAMIQCNNRLLHPFFLHGMGDNPENSSFDVSSNITHITEENLPDILHALEGQLYYGEYSPHTDSMKSTKEHPISHVAYGYAAQVVVLDDIGKVELIHAAYDAGRIVNPLSCEGQIEGGIVMGMGYALTEQFPLEEGYVRARFGCLGLLRADQVPEIKITFVEAPDIEEEAAYGVKGVGELATIPTAPAIAGAYYARDGKLRHSLPLIDTFYSES